MDVQNHAGYAIISIGNNENRFNPTFVSRLNEILDNLDNSTKGIVFTGTGKYVSYFNAVLTIRFFSNGLDLIWMGKNSSQVGDLLTSIYKLLARILVFPLPTVALINGISHRKSYL